MDDLNPFLEPGMYVRHPTEKDWGVGQVQSSIKGKVTVNFEETGKVAFHCFLISFMYYWIYLFMLCVLFMYCVVIVCMCFFILFMCYLF